VAQAICSAGFHGVLLHRKGVAGENDLSQIWRSAPRLRLPDGPEKNAHPLAPDSLIY